MERSSGVKAKLLPSAFLVSPGSPIVQRPIGRPEIVGGLSVALARAFTIIEPDSKNRRSWQWDRTFSLFNLLL